MKIRFDIGDLRELTEQKVRENFGNCELSSEAVFSIYGDENFEGIVVIVPNENEKVEK